ncbi:hypothetical protein JCM19000A_32930 [Silvimonas sp. JCM 19000]
MAKFLVFDSNGVLSMRLDDAVDPRIPADAIEVDDALFQQIMQDTNGVWMRDAGGAIIKVPYSAPAPEQNQPSRKFLEFDSNGVLIQRFDDAVDLSIPADAVEVSDAIFARTLQESDGLWTLDANGGVTKAPFPAALPSEERPGRKFILFDASGMLVQRYDDAVHADIPVEAIEVTEALFQQTIQQTDGRWTRLADGSITKVSYPLPTAEQIQSSNKVARDQLLATAALAIAPLQDAVDLDESTLAEAAALKAWKQYRVAVNRIDLTQASVTWPVMPEGGA